MNEELEKGYLDFLHKKIKPAVNSFAKIHKDYNI
jgi:hypothetical protein